MKDVVDVVGFNRKWVMGAMPFKYVHINASTNPQHFSCYYSHKYYFTEEVFSVKTREK